MTMAIRDFNLGYLMMAQKLIYENKPAAIVSLGINEGIADLISKLKTDQICDLANSPIALTSFRIEGRMLEILQNGSQSAPIHAAIFMTAQESPPGV